MIFISFASANDKANTEAFCALHFSSPGLRYSLVNPEKDLAKRNKKPKLSSSGIYAYAKQIVESKATDFSGEITVAQVLSKKWLKQELIQNARINQILNSDPKAHNEFLYQYAKALLAAVKQQLQSDKLISKYYAESSNTDEIVLKGIRLLSSSLINNIAYKMGYESPDYADYALKKATAFEYLNKYLSDAKGSFSYLDLYSFGIALTYLADMPIPKMREDFVYVKRSDISELIQIIKNHGTDYKNAFNAIRYLGEIGSTSLSLINKPKIVILPSLLRFDIKDYIEFAYRFMPMSFHHGYKALSLTLKSSSISYGGHDEGHFQNINDSILALNEQQLKNLQIFYIFISNRLQQMDDAAIRASLYYLFFNSYHELRSEGMNRFLNFILAPTSTKYDLDLTTHSSLHDLVYSPEARMNIINTAVEQELLKHYNFAEDKKSNTNNAMIFIQKVVSSAESLILEFHRLKKE